MFCTTFNRFDYVSSVKVLDRGYSSNRVCEIVNVFDLLLNRKEMALSISQIKILVRIFE